MRVKQKKNRVKRVSIEYFLYFCGLFNIKAENEYETVYNEISTICLAFISKDKFVCW